MESTFENKDNELVEIKPVSHGNKDKLLADEAGHLETIAWHQGFIDKAQADLADTRLKLAKADEVALKTKEELEALAEEEVIEA